MNGIGSSSQTTAGRDERRDKITLWDQEEEQMCAKKVSVKFVYSGMKLSQYFLSFSGIFFSLSLVFSSLFLIICVSYPQKLGLLITL